MFSTITAAPAKQSVSETIAVLSGRLNTATLLEDRRAAILGLRSFSKQYPASVASGALRSLIGSLSRDGEDVDTVKVVLETLLMLFSPNEDSPEASEEIALWLADEFTQRQENITLLLDLLDTTDFYSRLYSLQLLSHIHFARTERTEECVLVAPLGIPRLVAVLDDRREAVRDAAISLLIDLTAESVDIQKLVAFEKGFERIFDIITNEGGLVDGARVVEDCLILLANLLRLNSSNQSNVREMGFIKRLAELLRSAYKGNTDGEEVAQWAEEQRNRNIYALLALIRLFLVPGAAGTPANQIAFLNDRVLENTLQLGFTFGVDLPIRAEALAACADMIRGNARLQERFAGQEVPSPLANPTMNGQAPHANEAPKVYVIDGLLDLILAVNSLMEFDLRMTACNCLKAYFNNHEEIRKHFLTRAIQGHKMQADELTNIFTTLLQPVPEQVTADPYRYWFAAVLMLHLVHENPATKHLAMEVTEGDEASGEEVVTSIQTVASHLLRSVARNDDPRVIIGYLQLLLCWLFEDLDAVNDFLGEFTNLQGIIQAAVENPNGDIIVQGLSAMLIGVVYEFSTKDSPVPRAKVREMVMSRMGRDRYVDKLTRLRSYPLMRDYEILPQKLDLSLDQKLPDVYLDDTFVEFFKDNYSRIIRAIDRDPGLEISVITNGVQKGISRELVDSLRAQLEEKDRALEDFAAEKASLASQLGQEQADHRRTKEQTASDVHRANEAVEHMRVQLGAKDHAIQNIEALVATLKQNLAKEQAEHQRSRAEAARLKTVNDGLQRAHEQELNKLAKDLRTKEDESQKLLEAARREAKNKEDELTKQHATQIESLKREHQTKLESLQRDHRIEKGQLTQQIETARKTAEQETERASRRFEAEKADLRATISRMEVDLMKANKARTDGESKVKELETNLSTTGDALSAAERKLAEAEKAAKTTSEKLEELEQKLKVAEEDKEEVERLLTEKEESLETMEKTLKEKEDAIAEVEKTLKKNREEFTETKERLEKEKEEAAKKAVEEVRKELETTKDSSNDTTGEADTKAEAEKAKAAAAAAEVKAKETETRLQKEKEDALTSLQQQLEKEREEAVAKAVADAVAKAVEGAVEKAKKEAEKEVEKKMEEELKNAQSERDDLLLLFDDLEEKRQRYKEQLKKLGGEVSEDEEEEEEEEEDDAEEDGDDE
ncbi:p115 like vesicle tethering protein [Pseudoneurospora amorphoporcata]|uniref:P115 like vesicle tethering protein n=1 Tax=Pseudoneurospora amorphoporcata TaxID=241081 RepID=A0AAN6SEI3_9PEZI|nr:p115 like vesicle tethering protein [Pseudoneurospora amorphoporcata]